MSRKWLLTLGVALVLGVFGLTGCQPAGTFTGPISGLTFGSSQQQGIVVSGAGKVAVDPDIATLSLGIEAQEVTVAAAQTQAAVAMDRVMTSLTGSGVVKKDIQTQFYNITRVTRYDDKTQQQVFIGYLVTNTVSAKIRSMDKVGSIIDSVAVAGGDLTRINGISFSVENPTEFYNQARELAMADAKAKASQMANLAGVTLGKATFISESSYTPPIPSPVYSFDTAAKAVETPISPGETEIVTTVQVTFEIK